MELLSPARLAEGSATLAAAFHEDPLSRFLLPKEEPRRQWLRLTMTADLRQIMPEGHVYAVGDEEIAGVVGWLAPGRYPRTGPFVRAKLDRGSSLRLCSGPLRSPLPAPCICRSVLNA